MNTQSTFDLISKSFKALLLAAALYPLERIQSIQQLQTTYSNIKIKSTQNIIGEAVHHGFKSYFRGFIPFISKSALVTAASKITDVGLPDSSNQHIWGTTDWLSVGFGVMGYAVLYPLEIINLHMSAEVERDRFYRNTRECVSKIKKNQGVKTLYRGFFYSCSLFTLQHGSVRYLWKYIANQQKQQSQWQKISLLLSLFGATELLLYPLNTLKKLFQINGAIGHTDKNTSLIQAAKSSNILLLFRGLGTRLFNVGLYAGLYGWLLAEEQQ